jgi:peptidoglycan/LPS O-acetylase OafA/YrhL
MSKNEIRSLTGIRGIAALYVTIHHFYNYYYNTSDKTNMFCNKYWSAFFFNGYLAVDIFFLLSAFLITLSSGKLFEGQLKFSNYKVFMQKRWIRVYPAYFFVVVFGYVFILHFHRTANFFLSLTLLNLVFGLSHLFGHLWSLGAEWITYLLYPLFFKFSKLRSTNNWKYILICIGFFVLYANGAVMARNIFPRSILNEYIYYPCLIRCFGDYLIGIGVFYIYQDNKRNVLHTNGVSVLLAILIIANLFFDQLHLDILTVFLGALIIFSISKDNNWLAKFLSTKVVYFFGVISYPLYLIHYLVYEKLKLIQIFLNLHFHISKPYLTIFLGYMFVCILISTLFTYLLELPTIKYLNKLLRGKIVSHV